MLLPLTFDPEDYRVSVEEHSAGVWPKHRSVVLPTVGSPSQREVGCSVAGGVIDLQGRKRKRKRMEGM